MSVTDELIGRNLQRLRKDRSQTEIANAMKERGHRWTQPTVVAVEKGDRPLRMTEATDLVTILEQPLYLLLAEDETVLAHSAAQVVRAADRMLRESVQQYDRSRFELAMQLDAISQTRYATELGESWIDVSAHDVVDQVHDELNQAGIDEARRHGHSEADIAANQLEGRWLARLNQADAKRHTLE